MVFVSVIFINFISLFYIILLSGYVYTMLVWAPIRYVILHFRDPDAAQKSRRHNCRTEALSVMIFVAAQKLSGIASVNIALMSVKWAITVI